MIKLAYFYLTIIAMALMVSCNKQTPSKKVPAPPPTEDKEDPPPPPPPPVVPTSLIYQKTDGSLGYNYYANQGETNKVNLIPDFSMAGYKGGGVAIPHSVAIKKTLSPLSGDNRSQIQQAIDEVSALTPDANGIRGVIALLGGVYEVSDRLNINHSGVILRGIGQGADGTVLKATKKEQHTLINIAGTATSQSGSTINITTPYVGTGSKGFRVANVSGIAQGDRIVVERTPNQAWIDDLDMAQYGWTTDYYVVQYERKVVAVTEDSITLDAPVVDPIQVKYGGGKVYTFNPTGRITNCGIENLRLTSVYDNDDDENHGWIGIELREAENCWVRGVTCQYFGYSAVTLNTGAKNNTVEECAMLDPKSVTTGARKYSFNINGTACLNLIQRCFTRGGRHDYVTGAKVPGPNVFLDCVATKTYNDIGPHHRWATGLLFDNIVGDEIRVRNRGASGTGHGWAGAQTLFYNCTSLSKTIVVESPKGALNWGIGCKGLGRSGAGFWESWNVPVQPRSLYLAQLKDRLGSQAVSNIATQAQLSGAISGMLTAWAGEGSFN
ncbi:hypothetical protein [Niabella ginsengisoli]|uniref:Right-handed parallel beta-helix repeat-containing protein n=1 Tax=Niabella ginsengisoli TaxID=522298 RepID=A0ABS9SHM2_9BACT|nr:hypothetical protein [Niabella ginsengisoli]MCH5597873.1 hypothetical protein [Niabella ginsengisoli]